MKVQTRIATRWRHIPALCCLAVAAANSPAMAQTVMTNQPTTRVAGLLKEISAGGDGSIWGINSASQIYRWNASGATWTQMPGAALKIAVASDGAAWVVNSTGQIFRWNSGTQSFAAMPGGANTVGAGGDGSVYVVGGTPATATANNTVYKWNGASWDATTGQAVQVAADSQGVAWVVTTANKVWRRPAAAYEGLTDTTPMSAVAIGSKGHVWGLGADSLAGGNHSTYLWDGAKWVKTSAAAISMAIEPDGRPWFVQADGGVYRGNPQALAFSAPAAAPPASGSDNTEGFCWKATYTRGVGGVPGDCGAGEIKQDGLCYPACPAGATGNAFLCWANCPAGFTDMGVSCTKPGPTSSAGYAWQFGDTAFRLDGARSRCAAANANGCYTSGAIVYPNCAPNFHKVGDLICSPDCPAGFRDDGAFCAKATTNRGVGKIGACPNGTVNDAGLCYPSCGPEFDGVGPVCWGKCSGAKPYACGAGCALNAGACAAAVGDMTANTIGAAASLLSFVVGGPGIGAAAKTAAAVGRKAAASSIKYGVGKTLTQHLATASKAYAKDFAKTFVKDFAKGQVMNGRNRFFNGTALVKTGAVKGFNEMAGHFGVMKEEGSFDYSIFAAADPTGISSAVLSFTKYGTCTVEDFMPSTRSLDFGNIAATPTEKTITVNVYQNTTFTKIGAPALAGGCSIVPKSDCVGRTIPAGSSCSITVQTTTPASQKLQGEIRLYTTEFEYIPYAVEVKANSAATQECQDDPAEEAVNLTHLTGAWAYYSDINKKIMIDKDGNITPVNGWAAAGKATVQDANKRQFKIQFGTGFTLLTLSDQGDKMTDGNTTANRLSWDARCKNGDQWYAGLCYNVPVGYEITAPGFMGLPCPTGWRDDGTSCWPAWTGADIPGQAEKSGSMSTMKYPILVTYAGIECPAPNWSKTAITCSPTLKSKGVKSLIGTTP